MLEGISVVFLVNENHCHCWQCDALSAGADFTHRESVVWDKLLDQAGSLGIFLVIFSSMMCGASRDLPEGVGIMDHECVQSTRLPVLDCTCLR